MREIRLQTSQLTLRTLKEEDVTAAYACGLNDPQISKYLSTAGKSQTIETCLEYVRSYKGRIDATLIGIFFQSEGLHIGNLTLSTIDRKNFYACIGISIWRREFMGKGYASEALIAVRDYCFNTLSLHRLEACIAVTNFSSLKLFLRCGFRIEGCLRDRTLVDNTWEDVYILGTIRKEVYTKPS